MLSHRSRTLPPIKRSSRDFRTSKLYPSRIPVRIPFPKLEKQQRKMAFLDGEVNSGLGDAFSKCSSNFQQRNRLCAKTSQFEDECTGKKPEKEGKKNDFLGENSETMRIETPRFPSYGFFHRLEKNEGKMAQEKVASESDLALIKSSSWANSIDDRKTHMYDTKRTDSSFKKQLSIENQCSEEKRQNLTKRQTRSIGKHLQPLQEKLIEYPDVKVRGRRGNIKIESPPTVVVDFHEGNSKFEIENQKFLEDKRRVTTERKAVSSRNRTLDRLEEKRPCPVKRTTQSVAEKNTGIPCKPRLHKIHPTLNTHKT